MATAIEEPSATVKEVASDTQLTTGSATDADEETQHGLEIIKLSYHSIEGLAVEIDAFAQRINRCSLCFLIIVYCVINDCVIGG